MTEEEKIRKEMIDAFYLIAWKVPFRSGNSKIELLCDIEDLYEKYGIKAENILDVERWKMVEMIAVSAVCCFDSNLNQEEYKQKLKAHIESVFEKELNI